MPLLRAKTKENILNSSLNFLRLEYKQYFPECEKDFLNELFTKLKPRIYKENKIVINKGQKVNKLYFLLNGILFVFDSSNKNIFNINNSSIFCEYEFITGFKSEFTIKSHPRKNSYGFVIKKKDWNVINKKYIFSTKKFIKLCLQRRKNFVKKLNEIYENKKLINKDEIDNGMDIFDKIYKYQRNVLCFENNFIKCKEYLFEYLKYILILKNSSNIYV